MGMEMVEENVIFYCLVKVKRKEKKKWCVEFLLGSPFFFLSPNQEEKIKENGNEIKKITTTFSIFYF